MALFLEHRGEIAASSPLHACDALNPLAIDDLILLLGDVGDGSSVILVQGPTDPVVAIFQLSLALSFVLEALLFERISLFGALGPSAICDPTIIRYCPLEPRSTISSTGRDIESCVWLCAVPSVRLHCCNARSSCARLASGSFPGLHRRNNKRRGKRWRTRQAGDQGGARFQNVCLCSLWKPSFVRVRILGLSSSVFRN